MLNSEIFLVLNVALVSYRDLSLQNANKMTSICYFQVIFFYESIDYSQLIFFIFF